MGKWQSPPAEPVVGGRYKYNGVLSDALSRELITLISPPQFYAALGMKPATLAWVDHYPC